MKFVKFTAKSLLLLILLTLCSKAKAQMSGAYTIDTTAAASATNFKNWYSFYRSLQGASRSDGGLPYVGGITASVTVTVKSSNTEANAVQFPSISGSSSSKTITIDGNKGGAIVSIAIANGLIDLAWVAYKSQNQQS